MAFSIKIQGLPRDHGEPTWVDDMISWWPEHELMNDARFRKVASPGYLDYVAILTPLEARELAAAFADHALDHQRMPATVVLLSSWPSDLATSLMRR